MKRFLFALTLALVALAGCKKEPAPGTDPGVTPATPATIVFTTSKAVGETINLVLLSTEATNAELDGIEVESFMPIDENRSSYKMQLTKQTVTIEGDITLLGCYGNSITEMSFSKSSPLAILDCSDNELTKLNVGMLGKLTKLDCYDNKLTELNLAGCDKSLNYIACYNNAIKDEAMTALVNGLPDLSEISTGQLLIQAKGDGNSITEEDYEISKAKNWDSLDDNAAPINPYKVDFDKAKDLSNKYANCFIISDGGTYKFRAEKYLGDYTVDVLWETFGTDEDIKRGDLIKCAQYKNGYIGFQTADTFREGNAVIAIKSEDTIIWSWHLWLTDEPQEQSYYSGDLMMDRNLGATSNTPGEVEFLGLYYQWGRKDPFLSFASISAKVPVKSTIVWPAPVKLRCDLNFAIQNPTTYIATGEWLAEPWSNETDYTIRWADSRRPKSDFDPCPAGWRVPDGGKDGVWAKSAGLDAVTDENGAIRINMAFDRHSYCNTATNVFSNELISYPDVGWIDYFNTTDEKICVAFFGQEGGCWTATNLYSMVENTGYDDMGNPYWTDERYHLEGYSGLAYCFFYNDNGRAWPGVVESRGRAFSVRCCKDVHTGK
jgi:hypothetical protein